TSVADSAAASACSASRSARCFCSSCSAADGASPVASCTSFDGDTFVLLRQFVHMRTYASGSESNRTARTYHRCVLPPWPLTAPGGWTGLSRPLAPNDFETFENEAPADLAGK